MTQILDGKYIIELDELASINLVDWLAFQPNTVSDQAYRISLENFIKALPIIPAVAGEYDDIDELLTEQPGQTVDVFYRVLDPSDDPAYNDLKDSEIKSVYYHLVDAKTGSLSNYNSIAIPKLESSKFPKLGNSLEALTFDIKFRTAEWSSNQATLQAISNALKLDSPQDLLLSAESIKLLTSNAPANISRVLFGSDGQLIFEEIDASDIQSDTDATDVTLNDVYQLLLSITPSQQITKGIAEIGLTAKSFSTGSITAFQASGNNRVRATSANHGFSEGDYVEIVNTANYDSIYEIKAVPNINDFDFTATFAITETGDWEKSEDREIAVDLRVDSVSQKEFTRQIEGEGRLNFSDQISDILITEDIDIYVKSNTSGEAIEILGTTQDSELKVIDFDIKNISFPYTSGFKIGSIGTDPNTKLEFFENTTELVSRNDATEAFSAIGQARTTGIAETENVPGIWIRVTNFPTSDKSAAIILRNDGIISIGSSGDPASYFSRMRFNNDYTAIWDALSAGNLARTIIDYGYALTKFLSTVETTDQAIESNLRGKKQITVQGKTVTFTATPTFNLDDGNVQEMILTSNVTSLTLSNELDAGSYLIYLIQDGTGGHTIPTPDSTWGDPTDNSVDPANFLTGANDRNLINVAVSPSGFTEFSIETHDI